MELNKKLTKEEKETTTRQKYPGLVAQGHKLAALMKKRKEEILPNKEQSTIQPTVESTEQPSVQSNDTYIYGVGKLAVLVISVCVFFTYNTFQPKNKKLVNEKQDQPPKRHHMLQKYIQ